MRCGPWQARPLASVYPILYFDALFVKSRQAGPVQTKAMYLALGVTMDGEKELLGLWLSESEGAKFWLSVFTELHNRGVQDCFIACVDGLKGLPEAIEAVFARTQVQLCIVHKVGRIPAGCGYCFGTSPNPAERGQSAGHHHSKPVFKTPSMSLGLYLSTLSPSTSRSATSILF